MTKDKLKLCVVTGSRSEYGLLYPLMKLIKADDDIDMQVVVTGMHLSPEFGLTYREVEKDGFAIDEKVEMLLSGDTDVAIAKSTGLGLIGLTDALHRLQPHWVVLLGDRFETFAAAIAAHIMKIPIIHIHGGEVTIGATDDAFRHAITKMAYLHFTSAEAYRKRVIQLGEDPKRVFNVGAIGLDNVKQLQLLSRAELEQQLGFENINEAVLVTFHPATMEKKSPEQQVKDLINALDTEQLRVVFTLPNADANSRIIIKLITEFAEKRPERVKAFTSLGQLRYLSLLQYVKAVVGNSSSGIIEAPSFGIPTVNIGIRQEGRIRAESVIDAKASVKEIRSALDKAFSESFRKMCRKVKNPYGKGNAATQILNAIKRVNLPGDHLKLFYDL